MQTGDRVDVVLDVFTEDNDYRVVMVGVFTPEDHAKIPTRDPRAARNVVQTWLGTPHSFGAFRMSHTVTQPQDDD